MRVKLCVHKSLFLLLGLVLPVWGDELVPVTGPSQVVERPRTSLQLGDAEESPVIAFDSLKYWSDARWYLIGKFDGKAIQWLGGGSTPYSLVKPECIAEGGFPELARGESSSAQFLPGSEGQRTTNREILQARGWVAIETGPDVVSETLELRSPKFQEFPECRTSLSIRYAKSEGSSDEERFYKPILFLKPRDVFFGRTVMIYAPEKPQRQRLQLDLLAGIWKGTFPGAATNPDATRKRALPSPSHSITFLPVAVSRGEWLLPQNSMVGLSLSLEQTLRNFGGRPGQTVLFSDWFVGIFAQELNSNWQMRGSLKYHEHLADQGSYYFTSAYPNTYAKNLLLGGTFNYFGLGRIVVGVDLEYGIPNQFSGRGVTQSMMSLLGRAGFRVTSYLTLLLEGGYRLNKSSGYQAERLLMSQGGLRFDL